MNVTIVDYKSGNISSVINSFKEVAKGKVNIEVTSDLNKIKSSDKVVFSVYYSNTAHSDDNDDRLVSAVVYRLENL